MSEQFSLNFEAPSASPYESMSIDELKNAYKTHVGVSYRDSSLSDSEVRAEIISVLNNDRELERDRLRQIDRAEDKEDLDSMYRRTS